MKILLIFCSVFASLILSADPQILFDSDRNTKLARQSIELNRSEDGSLSVTKTSKADWGGFYLPRVSTSGLEGKAVRISGHVQVKSLNNTCQRRAIVKGVIWFQDKERATWKERIGSDSFFSLTEAGKEVAFDKTVPVPQNVKYMIVFLHFGYATGEFIVKDLKVEVVSPVKVEKRVNTGVPEKVLLLQPGTPASFSIFDPVEKKNAADVAVSYTPQGFDLRVTAYDSFHRQPFSDKRIWLGDSLQFAADPLLDRQEQGYNGGDDVEYGLALLENGKSFLHVFAEPADYPPPVSQIRTSVKRDEAGKKTEYQLYLPWQAFGPFQYGKMDRFGANILLNKCDEKGRHAVEWRPATAKSKRPAAMAAILLDKTKRGIMADLLPCELNRDSGKDYHFQAAVAAVEPVKGKISVTCNGKQVYDENTLFAQGETIFTFTLPNLLFKTGDNTISIAFSDAKEVFYTKSFKVSQISVKERMAQIEKLRKICDDKMAAVTPMIRKFDIDAAFPREQMISWKVCKLFLDWFIPEDIARKAHVLALRELKEVDAALTQLQKELKNKTYVLSKARNVMDLKIENGSLVGSDGPVFAFGIHGADGMRRLNWNDYKMMSMTYTSSSVPLAYWAVFPKTPDGKPVFRRRKGSFSVEWRKHNTTASPLIGIDSGWLQQQVKKWQPDALISGNHFLGYDPDHPKMREMVDILVHGAFRDLAVKKENILKDSLAFDLANEPLFNTVSAYTLTAYRNFLKQRYGTIGNYNRYYKSKFKSFGEITDIRSQMVYLPIACYDYCTFNEQRFYEFYKIIRDAARRGAGPESPIRFTMKLMHAHLSGHGFSAEHGYDVDLICKLTDMHGGDNIIREIHAEPNFTFNWRSQVFVFDLLKSVAPDHPIIDNEYHAAATSPDMVSAAFMMGAHHGLNAASWWVWNRDEKIYFRSIPRILGKDGMPYWFHESPDGNPAAMIAGSRTAIMMDRLMEEVRAFYTAPRPVRLFWSQTSINFIGANCAQALWKAYDKVSLEAGQPVGFLTEHKLLEGKIPEDMKILVITGTPYAQDGVWQALEKLEKSGVRVVRIGQNQITRNTFDEPMEPPRLKHPAVFSIAEWDIRKDIQSAGIAELARLVGENRQFVEARFVKYGDRVLGYAVNLGRKKAKLNVTDLQGKTLSIKTRGEIPARTMKEFVLAPREWILFEL